MMQILHESPEHILGECGRLMMTNRRVIEALNPFVCAPTDVQYLVWCMYTPLKQVFDFLPWISLG